MNLVFVHGRAQGGKDPINLKKLWVDTFKTGLAKSGLEMPVPDEQIHFPFYGDVLDDLVIGINQTIEGVIQRGNQSNNKDARFLHDLLSELSKNANISEQEIEKGNVGTITEKGPLNWPWVQAILRAIDRRTKWSEASIRRFTYDVFLYLTNTNIKEAINKEVKKLLTNGPCVVVGHSLGSIVCYNILRDCPEFSVSKLITVGSPLGLNSVKKYLKTPIKMPECVKGGWFNAYDDRDVVALNPLDKKYFNISPSIDNKTDVDNQTSNRHGIEGYLNDKIVAQTIYKALTGYQH